MVDYTVEAASNPQTARQKMAQAIPLQRLGQPAEVATLCVYLLSDEAGFITGADLPIDGGLTAQ
jgi:NAD(P)-dependent dehydrogenase (short-subunit alcohol dehydrogenase family)